MAKNRIVDLIGNLVETEQEKDSLEIGSAGNRMKIYLNFADPGKAKEKIDLAMGCRDYANAIQDADIDDPTNIERMRKFLERAEQDQDEQEEQNNVNLAGEDR